MKIPKSRTPGSKVSTISQQQQQQQQPEGRTQVRTPAPSDARCRSLDLTIMPEDAPELDDAAAKRARPNGEIAVIDDDPAARSELIRYFGSFYISAISVSGDLELYQWLARPGARLLILDLQTERENRLRLLRRIRSRFQVPVILTGDRGSTADGVIGLESGADDYLSKPLSLRELVARTRGIMRRRQDIDAGLARPGIQHRGYIFNGWTLDRRSRVLRDEKGEPVALTRGEIALLIAFLEQPGQILTRAYLLQALRLNPDSTDRSIDVTVARLRRKLRNFADAPETIATVRAAGYSLNAVVIPF
jgi:two-component system, OmpR family, response regulator